jgi:hypothetical protein
MTPGTVSSRVTARSFAALRAHRGFRAAVERSAADSGALFQQLDPAYQWIIKDIGRAAICVTALTLHLLDGLTVQALTSACLEAGISSAGRVQQLVRRCQEIGAMTVESGPGRRTRRPMRLGGELIRIMRERALADFGAMLALVPELGDAVRIVDTDEGFISYGVCVATLLSRRPDLFAFSAPPIDFFLEREAGMAILLSFIGAQRPDRARLLEEAPISRYALSRRYGVSRAHINKLLSDSGHIDRAADDRVAFSEALSEALERHFAAVFELNRCAAEVLASGWRYDPTRPVRRAAL